MDGGVTGADREQYVNGDYRFRAGYSRSNPRKMVKMWAEKEFRNLARMVDAGIRCPKPLKLQSHVLVMTFIGKDGKAAPRLKDANAADDKWPDLYHEVLMIMRVMWHACK